MRIEHERVRLAISAAMSGRITRARGYNDSITAAVRQALIVNSPSPEGRSRFLREMIYRTC